MLFTGPPLGWEVSAIYSVTNKFSRKSRNCREFINEKTGEWGLNPNKYKDFSVDKNSTTAYHISMINELLAKIGLNEKEIQVYLTVLQQGKITPTALSKVVGINRTTVYSTAKELVTKGLIREDLTSPVISLIARPLEDLEVMVEQEEREVRKKKELAKRAIHELQSVVKTQTFALPKIVFVPENELESYLYKQTTTWNESINKRDGYYWGFQDQTFVENYEKWIDWYWDNAKPEIKGLHLLSNEVAEQIKKRKFAKRQIRFWAQSKNFTATTWIQGDYVTMIVTNQHPHYLVDIHDAVLAHNLREVFKGIWETMSAKGGSASGGEK